MLGEALSNVFPGREFSCGETIDSIEWHDGLAPPSDEEIMAALESWPQKKENARRRSAILAELADIDAASIRPLRAGETEKLADLEAQAQALRDELKGL